MDKTFELKIVPHNPLDPELKDRLISWLSREGVHSYVEGVVDNLDLDPNYLDGRDDLLFDEAMEQSAPLLVYNFDKSFLETLARNIQQQFGNNVSCSMTEMTTNSWQTGWQNHFHPIETETFFVYPPWHKALAEKSGKIPLEIEPGMAFGTGQHESTQLCLKLLESLQRNLPIAQASVLDVGTGSGILAIAAAKLGAKPVYGSDVEDDAIRVARENAGLNQVELEVFAVLRNGPVTPPGVPKTYKIIFANILQPVLIAMAEDLTQACEVGGHLILSGILTEQAPSVLEAYAKDFVVQESMKQNDWIGITLKRIPR